MTFALILIVALLGHAGLWITCINHMHSRAWPRWLVRFLSLSSHALLGLLPIGFVLWIYFQGIRRVWEDPWNRMPLQMAFYVGFCAVFGAGPVFIWAVRRWQRTRPAILKQEVGQTIEIAQRLGYRPLGRSWRVPLAILPGSDSLRLEVDRKRLEIPRLHPELNGLRIVHLSDLHYCGTLTPAYFQEVVAEANRLEGDLIAVTGDLVDKAACIDWIPETLGRLRAPLGVYFVLGNHDLHTKDLARLRRTLADCSLIDLGARWCEVTWCGQRIILAGNELPWIAPAADMSNAPPRSADDTPLRVLLSHSPDQLAWARRYDFDLMLAGHTHGGQIRFPLLGPIVSPSRFGDRYASGTFYEPPTVMHVSRGIAGLMPFRWNCPPELTELELCSPQAVSAEHAESAARGKQSLKV